MTVVLDKTVDAAAHERATREYGSWDNFRQKERLDKDDSLIRAEYYRLAKTYKTEEDITEQMTSGVPYPMDIVSMVALPIYLIGAPDGSAVYNGIKSGTDFRARRKPEYEGAKPLAPFWYDYTDLGWPADQGCPRRMVSPEEHRDILRRLQTGALTRPGSPVALNSQTLASLMEERVPEAQWIIEGLLREGGAMMVYGPSGIGKTLFVHTLMLMAAHGREVGVRDDESGAWVLRTGKHNGFKVGLIDGEMTKADISQRTPILCGALGLKPGGSTESLPPIDLGQLRLSMEKQGTPPDEVEVWIGHHRARQEAKASVRTITQDALDLSRIDLHLKQDQHPKAVFPDVRDPEWKHQIIGYTQTMGVKVLILDNLSTLCPSLEDENAAAQWAPLNDLVVALKQAGVATIIVHHSGKSKDGGYRGSSALTTTLETSVELKKVADGDEHRGEARFKVSLPKKRVQGTPAIEEKTLRLSEGRWCVEVDEFSEVERVVAAIKSHRYASQQEVGDALRLTQPQVSRVLGKAYATGQADKDDIRARFRTAKELRDGTSAFLTDDPADALDI